MYFDGLMTGVVLAVMTMSVAVAPAHDAVLYQY